LLPRDILVAPLSTIDIERLQKGLDEYDVITVGPSSLRDYKGQQELLDHLAELYRFSRRQQNILREWLKHGGVLWVEFGISVQGYEWIRNRKAYDPPLPSLRGFTIFGYPTKPILLSGKKRKPFTVDPVRYSFRDKSRHPATTRSEHLAVTESALKTIYPIINSGRESLVTDGKRVYASLVRYGDGSIVSTLPFDAGDPGSDNESFKLSVLERLFGSHTGNEISEKSRHQSKVH